MRWIYLWLAVAVVFQGCEESSGDESGSEGSGGVALWDYFVADQNMTLTYDRYTVNNEVQTGSNPAALSATFTVMSETEVSGPYRDYGVDYNYTKADTITYVRADGSSTSIYGYHALNIDIGDQLYGGGYSGWSDCFGNECYSYTVGGGSCIVNAFYETLELYDGYVYSDVMEIACEENIEQKYSSSEVAQQVNNAVQRYKEYYAKGYGYVAKVDENCLTVDFGTYSFQDDANESCIETVAYYTLYNAGL